MVRAPPPVGREEGSDVQARTQASLSQEERRQPRQAAQRLTKGPVLPTLRTLRAEPGRGPKRERAPHRYGGTGLFSSRPPAGSRGERASRGGRGSFYSRS